MCFTSLTFFRSECFNLFQSLNFANCDIFSSRLIVNWGSLKPHQIHQGSLKTIMTHFGSRRLMELSKIIRGYQDCQMLSRELQWLARIIRAHLPGLSLGICINHQYRNGSKIGCFLPKKRRFFTLLVVIRSYKDCPRAS